MESVRDIERCTSLHVVPVNPDDYERLVSVCNFVVFMVDVYLSSRGKLHRSMNTCSCNKISPLRPGT